MIGKFFREGIDLVRWGASGALLAFFVMSFQNCGSDFVMKEGLDLASNVNGSKLTCELDAFKATYMPFLAKCKACHVPGGSGSGAFSSTNASVAYDAFLLATSANAANIDDRAVNANHAPGITGPANQAAIDTARPQYQNAMAACSGGTGTDDPATDDQLSTNPAVTTGKSIPSTASPNQTITFNLASEVVSGSTIPGATFSINVITTTPTAGKVYYQFSQPRITTTSTGLRIAKIMFKLNGVDVPLVTTYSRVNRTLTTNQTNVSLSTATAAFETTATSNSLAISYGVLVPQ